jgi:hypothetical protein
LFSSLDNNAILQFFNARNNGCIPTSNNQTLVIAGPLITNQAGNYNPQGPQGKPNEMNNVVKKRAFCVDMFFLNSTFNLNIRHNNSNNSSTNNNSSSNNSNNHIFKL